LPSAVLIVTVLYSILFVKLIIVQSELYDIKEKLVHERGLAEESLHEAHCNLVDIKVMLKQRQDDLQLWKDRVSAVHEKSLKSKDDSLTVF
jgi:hypothetical protein